MSASLQKHKARRAAALARVADGQWPVRKALLDGHGALLRCPVYRVLEAAPGMGPKKTRRALEQARVWPLLGLGELTDFEKQSILANLPPWLDNKGE